VSRGAAGNRGPDVRSDCYVELEIVPAGGRTLQIESKVARLYGRHLRAQCEEMLGHFQVGDCRLRLEDQGALPFVVGARLEAAIRQAAPTDQEFLLALPPGSRQGSARHRLRRSRLYLPGNMPGFMINAGVHGPDAVILDLEDAVAPARKAEARYLVRNALRSVDFGAAERMVRINPLPDGLEDLTFVVPHHVNLILVPKCESADTVRKAYETVEALRNRFGVEHRIHLMPILETASGVLHAQAIAAAPGVAAVAVGLEDLTADLGVARTAAGTETFVARSQVVLAARAAGVQAIDSVYSDVADLEGLARAAAVSKALGFDGMGCIHPRQIAVVHEQFAPTEAEIQKARAVVLAFEEAEARGHGVVSLGNKMIDAPVVKRARKTIEVAVEEGRLPADWRNTPAEGNAPA
jgi:citrate lyase subunit beta / citryl-CoA lyase